MFSARTVSGDTKIGSGRQIGEAGDGNSVLSPSGFSSSTVWGNTVLRRRFISGILGGKPMTPKFLTLMKGLGASREMSLWMRGVSFFARWSRPAAKTAYERMSYATDGSQFRRVKAYTNILVNRRARVVHRQMLDIKRQIGCQFKHGVRRGPPHDAGT